MSHPNFESQLDAYLDGELAAVDARELEAHVAQCRECMEFRDREVFVFRDPQGKVKVLHRKKDGKMELIEAP